MMATPNPSQNLKQLCVEIAIDETMPNIIKRKHPIKGREKETRGLD
jgi:hypothetical protein